MDPSNDKFFILRPDTEMTMRKMYNLEKPDDMDRAIDALEEWLKKQHHLNKKDYSRDFLKKSILFMKGSVERTKSQIDSLCSMRTIFPKFFEKYDAKNDFEGLKSIVIDGVLPQPTEDNYRINITHFQKDGTTNDILLDIFRFGIIKMEYSKANDYCNEYVMIIDFRNISLSALISITDFIMLHQFVKIGMEGYGMRIKGLHAVTSSRAIELLSKLVKPMFSPKIANRMYIHTTVETLYDHVSREILPPELGGYGESLVSLSEKYKNVVGSKENVNYIRDMSKAVSIEPNRMKEKLDGLDLGIAGTFRSLSVD